MGTTSTITCDGCQAALDPKKPDTMWHGQLPLPSVPLTEDEQKAGKKRLKYSITHSVVCTNCSQKLGEFLESLKPVETPAPAE
jgi:hypothetical protein